MGNGVADLRPGSGGGPPELTGSAHACFQTNAGKECGPRKAFRKPIAIRRRKSRRAFVLTPRDALGQSAGVSVRTKLLPAGFVWKRKCVFGLLLLLTAYVVSYLPRRSRGEYCYVASGALRPFGASAVADLAQWSPADCWWQSGFKSVSGKVGSRGDSAGYFYSPLIWVDRRWFFPDIPAL